MAIIRIASGILGVSLMAFCQTSSAHHSFAMFDQTKISELKGVAVAQFQWGNPHVYVVLKDGATMYTLECGSPSNMTKAGWKFNSLKSGDKINVTYYPLRNGKPGGALKIAILPNGKMLDAW